jgi:hypothetical protein
MIQSKSSEAEMDALKDEYHQRVATLERKVRHITTFFLLQDISIANW